MAIIEGIETPCDAPQDFVHGVVGPHLVFCYGKKQEPRGTDAFGSEQHNAQEDAHNGMKSKLCRHCSTVSKKAKRHHLVVVHRSSPFLSMLQVVLPVLSDLRLWDFQLPMLKQKADDCMGVKDWSVFHPVFVRVVF